LHKIFEIYGEIVCLQIPKDGKHESRGFANVKFKTKEAA